MGFYNYYRLLKEIRFLLRNKKVKKILTIIIIIIIVISILHTKGYCATPDYNIFPPLHNNYSYTELHIYPVLVSQNYYIDYNTMTLKKDNNVDTTGYYFELVQGWEYYIVNHTGSTFSYCTLSDVPSIDVHVGSSNSNVNYGQTYTEIAHEVGGGYCFLFTSDPSAYFSVWAYCSDLVSPLNESTAEYYLNSLNTWVRDLKTQNNQNLNDIKELLRSYIYGDNSKTEYPISSNTVNNLTFAANTNSFISQTNSVTVYFPIKNGYNYKFNLSNTSTFTRYGTCLQIPNVGVSGSIINTLNSPVSNSTIDYTSSIDGYYFFSIGGVSGNTYSVSCVSNYNEAQELGLSQTIINNNNNNTQIIDNTLTNSNIDVNDNQLVTDNTQDITQDGFTNIFTTIQTAFTGSPSAIVLPLGFLGNGQQLTLQPDFLSSAMRTGGLGVLVNVINAFWYFVVCRYIVKQISKIIENLKEGNLEETSGNIHTEVF